MGNSDSTEHETLPKSPLVLKIRDYIYLNPDNNTTSAFLSTAVSNEFRKEYGQISRLKNPFCPL